MSLLGLNNRKVNASNAFDVGRSKKKKKKKEKVCGSRYAVPFYTTF